MALRDYKEKKSKPKRRRVGPILVASLLIVLIVGVLAYYVTRPTYSKTVDCLIYEDEQVGAETVIGDSTSNETLTFTTTVSYTTSTDIAGPVGSYSSTQTTTTDADGYPAGVATVCKYISTQSTSSSTPT